MFALRQPHLVLVADLMGSCFDSGYKENADNTIRSHSKSILSNVSQDSVVIPIEVN